MVDLNDDIVTHIMASFKMDQVNSCYHLALTSSRFYDCFQKNKTKIDDHFTHVIIDKYKETHYYGDKIHRSSKTSSYGTDGDFPAVIKSDGTQYWYQHGKLHRDGDKPAIIWSNGRQEWYQYGTSHRDNDLPAVIWPSGTQWWFQHGKYHRDNGLPAIIWFDGRREWYKHGVRYYP